VIWDSELKGFGLRVSPAGQKTWIVECLPGEGGRRTPKRKLTLGPLGKLTPDQARKAAQDAIARTRLGSDPAEEKSQARRSISVDNLVADFLSEHVTLKRKPTTLDMARDLGGVSLVVIDPISAYLDGIDSHKEPSSATSTRGGEGDPKK
jgi:hypothetical protein